LRARRLEPSRQFVRRRTRGRLVRQGAAQRATARLAIVFATAEHQHDVLLAAVRDELPGARVVGCSGEGVIAQDESIESSAAAVMAIASNGLPLEQQPIDLGALVDAVVTASQPLIDANHNELVVWYSGVPALMVGDVTRVRQVRLNLVGNAAKFTSDGRVTFAVCEAGSDDRREIQFQVSDTGIGMTGDQMGRLFTEFGQCDTSTTRRFGGSGLGLAISQRLCRLMGGDISVSSVYGQGSTFVVSLPLIVDLPKTAAASVPSAHTLG
jgi:signal transduction histidine kinase